MWTNYDFKTWINNIDALKLSQERLKEEAAKFSPVFEDLNKKTVLKRVEDFLKIEKNNFVPGLIADFHTLPSFRGCSSCGVFAKL